MDDKDISNIFYGKQRVFVKPADSDLAIIIPLGEVVADSLQIMSDDVGLEDIMDKFTPLKTEYSFSLTSEQIAELPKYFGFKKMYDHAQSMLDDIKGDLKEFYQTNPPRNRKERRARAKELKIKINRFNSYCKDKGIEISSK